MARTSSPRRTAEGRGERHGHEVIVVDAQQGEVVAGVGLEDVRVRRPRFLRRAGCAARSVAPADDVGVGEDLAVGGQHATHCFDGSSG